MTMSQCKFVGLIAALQATGAALVFIGSSVSAVIQIGGYVLLFPGSLIAAILPLQRLWHPFLWRLWRTDAAGLSNLLYLPTAILANVLIWLLIRGRFRGRE